MSKLSNFLGTIGTAVAGALSPETSFIGPLLAKFGFDTGASLFEYGLNRASWNAQNWYNSPAAQMRRYAAAGLNPNLIYDQGTPGNATSIPTYQGAAADTSVGMQRLATLKQMQLMDADIRKGNAEARNAEAVAYGNELSNYRSAIDNQYYNAEKTYALAAMDIQNRLNEGKISLNEAHRLLAVEQKALTIARQALTWTDNSIGQFRLKSILPLQMQLMDQDYEIGQQEISRNTLQNAMLLKYYNSKPDFMYGWESIAHPIIDDAVDVAGAVSKFVPKSKRTRYNGPYRH